MTNESQTKEEIRSEESEDPPNAESGEDSVIEWNKDWETVEDTAVAVNLAEKAQKQAKSEKSKHSWAWR